MLIYILIRYGLIRYMLTKYIVIDINTIRVIFYIWQRNNLLPIFLCGVLWGKMEECGEGKIWSKGATFTPLLSSKINSFWHF